MKALGLTHDELSAKVAAEISTYTIGFLKMGADPIGYDVESAGSGTLVKIGPLPEILTAAHALEHLPKDEPIPIVAFDRPGQPPCRAYAKRLKPGACRVSRFLVCPT